MTTLNKTLSGIEYDLVEVNINNEEEVPFLGKFVREKKFKNIIT